MAEVHQLPDRDDAEREASDWIARLNADDVSADDRARFEAWRGNHPHHARAYAEVLASWRELMEAGPLVRAVSFGQAMNVASSLRSTRRPWVLGAAVALGAFALVFGWYLRLTQADTRFQTAIGEQATVALPDGSSLELNSDSRASVDFGKLRRVVRLERGEAFFNVAHDSRRPFWVIAGDSWVRAVGTAFNVYVRPSGVQVTVSEGTVRVAGEHSGYSTPTDAALGQPAVSVTKGEQVDVRGRAAVIRSLDSTELGRSVAWRRGSLYFENQPLGSVLDEMMRYTPLKIQLGDPSLRQLPIGGTFQANPEGVEELLTMLRDGFGLSVRRDARDRAYVEGEPVRK